MTTNDIICGDSMNVLKTLRAESIDAVLTASPYLCSYRDRDGRSLANDDNPEGVLPVFEEIYRTLKRDTYCVSFYGWNAIDQFSVAWSQAGFRCVGHIVWPKRYASRKGLLQYCHESAYVLAKGFPDRPCIPLTDVQTWVYSGNKHHPTEKAIEIISPLVQAFSKPGDILLDPFSGSGSVSVAAALNNRHSIGVELDERYCQIAQKRLQGAKAWKARQKALALALPRPNCPGCPETIPRTGTTRQFPSGR